jgi:hypothetical protein
MRLYVSLTTKRLEQTTRDIGLQAAPLRFMEVLRPEIDVVNSAVLPHGRFPRQHRSALELMSRLIEILLPLSVS